MKKNLISIVKNQHWFIKTLVCIVLIIGQNPAICAQTHSELLTAEIEVFNDTKIEIEGPDVKLFGTGTIDTRHSKQQFRIAGKNEQEPILILNNILNVNTWEQSVVKLEHELTLKVKEGVNKDELIQDLQPILSLNAANTLSVSFFSNLVSLQIENGWFKDENSRLHFKNGNIHGIDFLEISTTIYVPKSSTLHLSGNKMVAHIGEHKGTLKTVLESSDFTAAKLSKLIADFSDCNVNIDYIEDGNLDFKSCDVQIQSAEYLDINSCLSSLDIEEVETLKIKKTLNDECRSQSIHHLNVDEGLFSQFDFGTLEDALDMQLLNSDVNIDHLGAELESLVIVNKNGDLSIGIEKLEESLMTLRNANLSKLSINKSFIELEEEGHKKIYKLGKAENASTIDISCELCTIKIK